MRKGFTLIELLIVIAVLGVLAAGVLVAINPGEQLARARDSSRKTAIGQLSKALQAYYTFRGRYPASQFGNTLWITVLVNSTEIKSVPAEIPLPSGVISCPYGSGQGWNRENGYCFIASGTGYSQAIVFTKLESGSEKKKCPDQDAFFLWASEDVQAGVVCIVINSYPTAASGYEYK